jgi:hypothetical protein
MEDKRISFPVYLAHRTTRAAKGTVGGALNLGPIIGAGALGAVSAWQRWPMIFEDTYSGVVASAIVYTLIAWCVVFVWRFMVVVPYQMYVETDAAHQDALAQLNALQSPLISRLKFGDDGQLQKAPLRGNEYAFLYRIVIENRSDRLDAANVELRVVSCVGDGGAVPDYYDRLIRDKEGNSPGRMNPLARQPFDLIAVRTDKNPPRLYFGPQPPGYGIGPQLPPGSYEITIEATASGTPPERRSYRLVFRDDAVLKWSLAN